MLKGKGCRLFEWIPFELCESARIPFYDRDKNSKTVAISIIFPSCECVGLCEWEYISDFNVQLQCILNRFQSRLCHTLVYVRARDNFDEYCALYSGKKKTINEIAFIHHLHPSSPMDSVFRCFSFLKSCLVRNTVSSNWVHPDIPTDEERGKKTQVNCTDVTYSPHSRFKNVHLSV